MRKLTKGQPPKGFRDFMPDISRQRFLVVEKIRKVFKRFGFEPLETAAIEYEETLLGKYGKEADKLLYLFSDRGGRKVGLRYDLTVPLSRVAASLPFNYPLPFKRYQIQPVWRAEKPQKGRFREFLQCDIDIVGSYSYLADVEIILCSLSVFEKLGLKKAKIKLNDREVFDKLKIPKRAITTFDKLEKIGKEKVLKELKRKGIKNGEEIFSKLKKGGKTERLGKIFELLSASGYKEGKDFEFDPFLARGLDYYTSTIFEAVLKDYKGGSIAGGGRYDELIGLFSGRNLAAVGISFGIERIIEVMKEFKLLVGEETSRVLVTSFSEELLNETIKIAEFLRNKEINTEIYTNFEVGLDKQLKYADKKKVRFVVIFGPDEKKENLVAVKDMETGRQEKAPLDEVVKIIENSSNG